MATIILSEFHVPRFTVWFITLLYYIPESIMVLVCLFVVYCFCLFVCWCCCCAHKRYSRVGWLPFHFTWDLEPLALFTLLIMMRSLKSAMFVANTLTWAGCAWCLGQLAKVWSRAGGAYDDHSGEGSVIVIVMVIVAVMLMTTMKAEVITAANGVTRREGRRHDDDINPKFDIGRGGITLIPA